MPDSTAFNDIGPSAPSRAQIASRIRRARDELAMAELRLAQHETAAALRRLQRAAEAAAPKIPD
jgi:hypothetical protein